MSAVRRDRPRAIEVQRWTVIRTRVGYVAERVVPSHDAGGAVVNVMVAVVGALFGALLANALGVGHDRNALEVSTSVVVVFSSLLVVAAYRAISDGHTS